MGGLADVHPRMQGKGGAAGTLLYTGGHAERSGRQGEWQFPDWNVKSFRGPQGSANGSETTGASLLSVGLCRLVPSGEKS